MPPFALWHCDCALQRASSDRAAIRPHLGGSQLACGIYLDRMVGMVMVII